MIIQYTEQGYWLASGSYRGRTVLAEGETRHEAREEWIDHAAGIDNEDYLGVFPFAGRRDVDLRSGYPRLAAEFTHVSYSSAKDKLFGVLPIVCAWCNRVYNGRDWFEPTDPPADPVSHGICDACKAEVESDIAASEFRVANGGTGATPGFGLFGEPECLGELKSDPDEFGYLNAGPVHSHMRNLERHDNGEIPFAYMFDDPAIERAYDVAQFYLHQLQGEYFARQYEEAWRRGEI